MHKIQGWHLRPHGGRLLVIPFAHTSLPCLFFTPCSLTTCVHKPIKRYMRVAQGLKSLAHHSLNAPGAEAHFFTAVPNNVMGYK